jgi:hypothetical protein
MIFIFYKSDTEHTVLCGLCAYVVVHSCFFLVQNSHIRSLENESTIIVRVIMETNFGAPNRQF